jgi:UDP-glucose:glycoprotein glucosyltransferase
MAGSSSHLATPQSLLAALGYETPVVNDITEGKPILQQDESLQQLLNGRSVNEIDSRQYDRYISISRDLYSKIGAVTGQQAFIINGRVVGPFPAGSFQAADINVLINYELRKRVGPVMEALFDIQGHEKEGLSS